MGYKELLRPPLKTPVQKFQDMAAAIDALRKWAEQVSVVINNLVGSVPDDSTAVDVAGIVSDFNDLLAVIKGLSTE